MSSLGLFPPGSCDRPVGLLPEPVSSATMIKEILTASNPNRVYIRRRLVI
jgi:hypothetical protein